MTGEARILVIKLSAFGDFIMALGPMRAIRDHHRNAHITLLTTKPYVALAEASGLFDRIIVDARPKLWQVGKMWRLARTLRAGGFDRVYDLQTSDRSSFYFRLFGRRKPEWSGIAPGCSHPHANPRRDFIHTIERQRDQLRMAGIEEAPLPDLSFLTGDIARFAIDTPFALLVPGGAAHRPGKRWPADCYGALAQWLTARGVTPVLIGGAAEADVLARIVELCPTARDLGGQTSFGDIAELARAAVLAVGNDTGPMHVIAPTGCPTLVLFSADSDPDLTRPVGPDVAVLQRPSLGELTLDAVTESIEPRLVRE